MKIFKIGTLLLCFWLTPIFSQGISPNEEACKKCTDEIEQFRRARKTIQENSSIETKEKICRELCASAKTEKDAEQEKELAFMRDAEKEAITKCYLDGCIGPDYLKRCGHLRPNWKKMRGCVTDFQTEIIKRKARVFKKK